MRKQVLFVLVCALFISACGVEKQTYVEKQEMTLNFEFGERSGIYTGEVEKSIPNGYGEFCSETGEDESWTYYGEWKNGHFQGYGITEWENGTVQAGRYENDLYDGWELWVEPSGEVYTCKYEDGEVIDALVPYVNEEQEQTNNDIFSDDYAAAALWAETSFGENVIYSELGQIGNKEGTNFQIVVPSSYKVEEANLAWEELKNSGILLTISGMEYETISISYYSPQNEIVLNALLTMNNSGDYELTSIAGDLVQSDTISYALTN